MNRLLGAITIKGNGTELFVRSVSKELNLDILRQIIGRNADITCKPPENHCFVSFNSCLEAATGFDSLKTSKMFYVRYAFKNIKTGMAQNITESSKNISGSAK